MLRVMELTKKGTPHFHLCLGNVPEDVPLRCYGNAFDVRSYKASYETCGCLSHVLGRVWSRVQGGESYIVHVVPVSGAKAAGSYMAKYMMKDFDGERMKRLGMTRRFSRSRNWPSEPRARFEVTLGKGWHRTWFAPGEVDIDAMSHSFSESASEVHRTAAQAHEYEKSLKRRLLALVGGMRWEPES